ncbi:META domain-containing protein [Corynebacterium sp. NML140438]|uniref:META domain-containing protein n=1 Tax=Corynebacterium sp. NML140438 TaxID=1906334 RepID=UPI0009F671C1|nr:META domain-containing protein [Corynebacterium sp. NML140438]
MNTPPFLQNLPKDVAHWILPVITTAISLAVGLGIIASSGSLGSSKVDVPSVGTDAPKEAVPATGEALATALNTTWAPIPVRDGATVTFIKGAQGYTIGGGPCNGYGVGFTIDEATGAVSTFTVPTTKKACKSEDIIWEKTTSDLLKQTTSLKVFGQDKLFAAGPEGTLELVIKN